MLRNLPFLPGAGSDVVERLADHVVEKTVQAGELVLEEGTTGREMYLIVEGCVEVIKRQGADDQRGGSHDRRILRSLDETL